MTDKEKIDVTKCLHFDKSDIPNGCTCYWDGECNHYCYYKKYIYKHQECEELKEDRERWKSNFNGKVSAIEELLHQLDQLKAENEELRRSITKIFACLIKANRTNGRFIRLDAGCLCNLPPKYVVDD